MNSRRIFLIAITIGAAAPGWCKGIDLKIDDLWGFTGAGSFVQVRENNIEGDHLEFRDLGLNSGHMPTLHLAYWMNQRSYLAFQFRYFAVSGSSFLSDDVNFNGATIAGGQTLHTDPLWYSAGFFYGRRWTPSCLVGGDLKATIGLEYTHLDFRINNGHAPVTPSSAGQETKEGFNTQELPIPTIGLDVCHRLTPTLMVEEAVQGNYINNWNSGRKEGGTIYLSQHKLELHLRLRADDNGRFKSFHPMAGIFYYTYFQREESNEDGNVIKWSAFGPELGVEFKFQ